MKIKEVFFDNDTMYVRLTNGVVIGNPIGWYKRLAKATPKQREAYTIGHWGDDIRWEDIDEDISLAGVLRAIDYEKAA